MYPFPVRPPEPKYVSILKSATKLALEGDTYEALGKLIQFCEHPENQGAEDRKRLAIEQVADAITAHHDKAWSELRNTLQALKKVPQRERSCPKRYRNGLSLMVDEFDSAMVSVFERTWDIASCRQLLSPLITGDWAVEVGFIKEARKLFTPELSLGIPE